MIKHIHKEEFMKYLHAVAQGRDRFVELANGAPPKDEEEAELLEEGLRLYPEFRSESNQSHDPYNNHGLKA